MWRTKEAQSVRVKYYWEIIADNLSKAGWSLGCVSAIDSNGRTIWIADAHRDDGKRLFVQCCPYFAGEPLPARWLLRPNPWRLCPAHEARHPSHERRGFLVVLLASEFEKALATDPDN